MISGRTLNFEPISHETQPFLTGMFRIDRLDVVGYGYLVTGIFSSNATLQGQKKILTV